VDEAERSAFIQHHRSGALTLEAINGMEMEVNRLQLVRRERMGDIMGHVRQQMGALFDSMHMTPAQKSKFLSFNKALAVIREPSSKAHDAEALLSEMLADVDTLKARLETLTPIYANIKKRAELLHERKVYNQLLSDPDRLLSRKRRGKDLKEEQKMRRRVTSLLPRLEKRLREQVSAWQQTHNDEVMFECEQFLLILERETAQYNQEIEKEKKDRSSRKKRLTERRHGTSVRLARHTPQKARRAYPVGADGRRCRTPKVMTKTR